MKLYVKYMQSLCCKTVVETELDKLGMPYDLLDFGEVDIHGELTLVQQDQLKTALEKSGLELVDDKKSIMVEKIRSAIIEMLRQQEGQSKENLSDYLSEKLNHNYTYLANLFSEEVGTTLEQFLILQRIERTKDLLLHDDLTLTEISYLLNYSSVGHLSNQFKKVTGLTPSIFKKVERERRAKLGYL